MELLVGDAAVTRSNGAGAIRGDEAYERADRNQKERERLGGDYPRCIPTPLSSRSLSVPSCSSRSNIPSGSMIPTLLVGDYLFVSKYSYGFTHYSFPFSPPIFSGRILGSDLRRGDVVVFRLPEG